MRRLATILAVVAILTLPAAAVRSDRLDTQEPAVLRPKWPTNTITVAFSSSLRTPGANIKSGSDVLGAARRALVRWSSVANLRFVETSSSLQSISPATGGDGVSLITLADTEENNAIFTEAGMTGRTRIFYDDVTGAILEADIAINPRPVSTDGSSLQFSTDGSPGTYDLESTLVHELGHLLGLEHSAVIGSTMQPRQALNGVYKLPALTERTLSENDKAIVRGLYGPFGSLAAIEGRMLTNGEGGTLPASNALVWAEDVATGRVVASSISSSSGNFRIDGVPPGNYRVLAADANPGQLAAASENSGSAPSTKVVRGAEIVNQIRVRSGASTGLNTVFVVSQGSSTALSPNLIGTNNELSTTPLPLEAGKRFTIYISGSGVDEVPGSGISVTSPFFSVDPASLSRQDFSSKSPIISFDVTIAANVPVGEYTLRLQSNSGQVAYLVGGITIDPGVDVAVVNAEDDARFFVRQHYRDFLDREPDPKGLEYWANQLSQCGSNADCFRKRRVAVSAAFLSDRESQDPGTFLYGLYKSTLGRAPKFIEFIADRRSLAETDLTAAQQNLLLAFVARPEFLQKFPEELTAEQFVDALLTRLARQSGVDLLAQKSVLVRLYDGTPAGRAAIVHRIIDNSAFKQAESKKAFVLLHYFGYLRRDPDATGYDFWLDTLKRKSLNNPAVHQGMACAFITSAEYQFRFGLIPTHDSAECGR